MIKAMELIGRMVMVGFSEIDSIIIYDVYAKHGKVEALIVSIERLEFLDAQLAQKGGDIDEKTT